MRRKKRLSIFLAVTLLAGTIVFTQNKVDAISKGYHKVISNNAEVTTTKNGSSNTVRIRKGDAFQVISTSGKYSYGYMVNTSTNTKQVYRVDTNKVKSMILTKSLSKSTIYLQPKTKYIDRYDWDSAYVLLSNNKQYARVKSGTKFRNYSGTVKHTAPLSERVYVEGYNSKKRQYKVSRLIPLRTLGGTTICYMRGTCANGYYVPIGSVTKNAGTLRMTTGSYKAF